MVSHRLFSISAVFGGKNSKEIAGDFTARSPSAAGGVNSVIAPQTPGPAGQTSGLAIRPLEYAEWGRPNSPPYMGSCPIFTYRWILCLEIEGGGLELRKRHDVEKFEIC